MMGRRFWFSALISCMFALALVWQAGRFTALREKADELDNQQEKWSADNRKLEADISILMSRQRAADMAASMGLVKIDPANRLRIVVTPSSQSGAASGQSSAPRLPFGGTAADTKRSTSAQIPLTPNSTGPAQPQGGGNG